MVQSANPVTAWVAQTPERVALIHVRASRLVSQTSEEHFRRLIAEWAQVDDGPLPTRKQAVTEAQFEIETLCRAIGRLGALDPSEVFPRQSPATAQTEEEGW